MCAKILLALALFSITAFAQSPEQGYVPVNGGKLYYEATGQGHAVVFIHGGQLDRRMWDEQGQFFSKKFRVIRYDVRGFGNSIVGNEPYSDKEDLAALLKHLKIDKAYIVGLSLGGRIAIDFAIAHPEMAEALVLAGPGLSGFNFTPDPNQIAIIHAAQDGDLDKATDLWLQTGYMAPAMKNAQIAPRIRQLARDNAKQELANPLLSKDLFSSAVEKLPEIKAPTLIMVGSLDVTDIHKIAGLLRARIPFSRDEVIKNAGHMLNMERPQEFDSIVQEFLERQPPIKVQPR